MRVEFTPPNEKPFFDRGRRRFVAHLLNYIKNQRFSGWFNDTFILDLKATAAPVGFTSVQPSLPDGIENFPNGIVVLIAWPTTRQRIIIPTAGRQCCRVEIPSVPQTVAPAPGLTTKLSHHHYGVLRDFPNNKQLSRSNQRFFKRLLFPDGETVMKENKSEVCILRRTAWCQVAVSGLVKPAIGHHDLADLVNAAPAARSFVRGPSGLVERTQFRRRRYFRFPRPGKKQTMPPANPCNTKTVGGVDVRTGESRGNTVRFRRARGPAKACPHR